MEVVSDNAPLRAAMAEIRDLASSLSARELGILRSGRCFEEEVQKIYANGRQKIIPKVMRAYAMIHSIFFQLRPDLTARERRWSPPKGAANETETIRDAVQRETWEETGLHRGQYELSDSDAPFVYEYAANGRQHCLVLYVGHLRTEVAVPLIFPLYNEGSKQANLPFPAMSDEIARTGLIPVASVDEFVPLQYGQALKAYLIERLLEHSIIAILQEGEHRLYLHTDKGTRVVSSDDVRRIASIVGPR